MNTKGGLTKRNTAVAGQKKDESLQGLIRAMEPEIKKPFQALSLRNDLLGWYLQHYQATRS